MGRYGMAAFAVAIVWTLLDLVIHNGILGDQYAATSHLWRPMEEMNYPLMNVVVLITAAAFTALYSGFVSEKSLKRGVLFGAIFGLGTGVSMAYGTYAFVPIPYSMALVWFLGSVVEGAAGGVVLGLLLKPAQPAG